MDPKQMRSLLNPIRMRIILVLTKKGECTTKDFQDELQEVPQASLYRHINKLVKDGNIEVVSKTQKRGAIERTFKLKKNPYQEVEKKALTGDKDEISEIFYSFAMTLLTDFNEYLHKEDSDMQKDSVGFRSYPLYLTDEENQEFLKDFSEFLVKYASKQPGKGRIPRRFSFVYTPTKE